MEVVKSGRYSTLSQDIELMGAEIASMSDRWGNNVIFALVSYDEARHLDPKVDSWTLLAENAALGANRLFRHLVCQVLNQNFRINLNLDGAALHLDCDDHLPRAAGPRERVILTGLVCCPFCRRWCCSRDRCTSPSSQGRGRG
jgi:hypothetical protein